MSLRIGTRGSKLALAQTRRVTADLDRRGIETETVLITTPGDTTTGVPLHAIGGQGVFVRALDDAILEGRIDAAVHSMKDIPAARPDGLSTCAVLRRDSPADFLVHSCDLEEVRVVGTSSTRRRAQLLRSPLPIEVRDLRGNVDTRLKKMENGEYDAIVLAEAGMQRLGLDLPGTRLLPQWYVPSPNQGAIAVVCRDDPDCIEQFEPLDHFQTRKEVEIERAVMEEVGGGCFTPMGIFCESGFLIAEVLALDGSRWERIEDAGIRIDEAREVGEKLRMIARDLIEDARVSLGVSE
ncbi:MAG: hydroxymethylbilane synthase [Methanomicrobiaceae archaeon]|nr:hydroxymethylbilane synthase [Methanomicrobiaceae archaeon]